MRDLHQRAGPNPWVEDDTTPQARRRRPWIGLLVVSLIVAGGGYLVIDAVLDRGRGPTASAARLTLAADDGATLLYVNRWDRPEVYYRVVLKDAPIGRRLRLTCDWVDPYGRRVFQNRYETRSITSADWPTHARYRFGPGDAPGPWIVRLASRGRVLSESTLLVRGENPLFDSAKDSGPAAKSTDPADPAGGSTATPRYESTIREAE